MVKLALLIGTSQYGPGFNQLPAATKDVEAMQRVLQHPDMGDFDQVQPLIDPDPQEMGTAIENLFGGGSRDDLLLLFFSGHGVKDESGNLYLATRVTRKNDRGGLIRSTAIAARFVQEIMRDSRAKRQVVILDCCFSGAFGDGLLAKDDSSVDVRRQLGGEGRVVLTSSTSTQYSFEQQGSNLSIYTRYLVEGIETGAADLDEDDVISVDELHEYANM
ncbi:MAG: caspase family protein, partial [Coleofasciculus sp. C3-bin4]|nr:caspase family protein [Coleofasciculus sp. C3-bin4]